MRLPRERGPVSRHVLDHLRGSGSATDLTLGSTGSVLEDGDLQLALWVLYELHYRGFDGVDPDLDWDPHLIVVRRQLERLFEAELREATRDRLRAIDTEGELADVLLDFVAADDAPSTAAYLLRRATRAQMLDYLRERSVQQLKEADPQAFLVPRLEGAAKVALAEMQYDEFGGGRPDRLHQALYVETMTAAGLDPAYGAYIDEVSARSLANANVMSLFALNRRLRGAAAGHFAAFEATSSVPSRKIAGGIARLGFPDAVAAYFDEHVEADAVHEQIAARDLCGTLVAEQPELREDVLFGAAACLHLEAACGREFLDRWAERSAPTDERVLEQVS